MNNPELIQLRLLTIANRFSFTISFIKKTNVVRDRMMTRIDSTLNAYELKVVISWINTEFIIE